MRTRSLRPVSIALGLAAAGTLLGSVAVAGPASAGPAAPTDQAKAVDVSGTVVRAGNGKPVAGVLVTVRDIDGLSVLGSGVTNSRGVYRIDVRRDQDEYAIKFNGRSQGFETGFLACGGPVSAAVVPTWGEACSHSSGPQLKARLQAL